MRLTASTPIVPGLAPIVDHVCSTDGGEGGAVAAVVGDDHVRVVGVVLGRVAIAACSYDPSLARPCLRVSLVTYAVCMAQR